MDILSTLYYQSNSTLIEKLLIRQRLASETKLDDMVRNRLNIWVTGVNVKSHYITYFAVSKHLRGLINQNEYSHFGRYIYDNLIGDKSLPNKLNIINKRNDSNQVDDFDLFQIISKRISKKDLAENKVVFNQEMIELGIEGYSIICNELKKGLDALPNMKITCYRYLQLLNNSIYRNKIIEGDFIMDKSFTSSSLLRGAGGKGQWYSKSSSLEPTAFFIIKSLTGKYIAQYSAAFHEHEVVFKNDTIFQVSKIIHKGDNSTFVFVKEVEKVDAIVHIKNPFNGEIYPH